MASSGAKRPRFGERTLLACQLCKQKKLKCDAQVPTCQNCLSKARDCLVEDPATGLLRPRGYMQSLETRVAYLEELLRQNRPDVATDHFTGSEGMGDFHSPGLGSSATLHNATTFVQNGNASHALTHASPSHSADFSRLVSHETQGDGSDLASEVALLALGAAGREPQYFGPSSALSFARVAGAAFSLQKRHEDSQLSGEIDAGSFQPRQMKRRLDLPLPHEARNLSGAFFNNIHPQYPILHRPTFIRWEEQCMQANQLGNLETAPRTALFFVLMVYAIGSLIVDNGDQSNAETYYLTALEHIEHVIDMDRLESVQALLACAVYSIRSPEGASIWKLSGMAIRHCIELGYHRSAKRFRPHGDALTTEMSKRVFWVAYDIDRAAAFALGRPFGIPDEMIDAELPCDVDDSAITTTEIAGHGCSELTERSGPLTGAIHIVKLRRIWSKIGDSIYSTSFKLGDSTCSGVSSHIVGLRRELDEWKDAIPVQPELPDTGPITVFASRDWFQLAYCHSVLLLYRHYLTCTASQASTDQTSPYCTWGDIDAAYLECAARAREICLLYRRTYQRSPVRYTWGSLHILFLGGLTYLHCLWSSEAVRKSVRQMDVINTCTACTMVLVIIAERWSKARTYRDVFEQLSEQTLAFICGATEASEQIGTSQTLAPVAASSDFSYSRMRSNAPVPQGDTQLDDWIFNLETGNVDEYDPWLVQDLLRGFGDPKESSSFMSMNGY